MRRLDKIAKFLKIAAEPSILVIGDRDSTSAGMVTMVQSALRDLGYDLKVDGIYGKETAGAVFAFRSLNDFEEGNFVDWQVFKKIFSPDAKPYDNSFRSERIRDILESADSAEAISESNERVSESALFFDLMSYIPNKNLCIAMVANAIHESGLNPGAAGDCGAYAAKRGDKAISIKSKGLCCSFGLWQLNVCGGLGIKFLEQNGNPADQKDRLELLSDYSKQISFMTSYIKSKYSSLIRQEKSPEDWAEWFVREVERPADPDGASAKRRQTAERLQEELRYA